MNSIIFILNSLSDLPEEFSVFRSLIDEINIPSATDKVYKEECLITCDTAYAEKGLFICMKTWKSLSSCILKSYVQQTGNKIFLNIRKIRLVKDPADEPEPKKLAIGDKDGFRIGLKFIKNKGRNLQTLKFFTLDF